MRVWLVDDNDRFRDVLANLLGPHDGIQCERNFACAETALAALQQEAAPDVILLDVNLGQKSGVDAIQPLRARAPATQVVMLTTFFDSKAQSQALSAGARGFLLKSYSLQEIVQGVHHAHRDPLKWSPEVAPEAEATDYSPARRSPVVSRGLFDASATLNYNRAQPGAAGAASNNPQAAATRNASPLLERGLRRFRALVEATGPWSRTAVE